MSHLRRIVADLGSAVVAFSGGVDSSYLLWACRDVMKERVLAVTAVSPVHASWDTDFAGEVARSLSVEHMLLRSTEMDDAAFVANTPERCYLCKRGLFTVLRQIAQDRGLGNVIEGSNADDASEFRPGRRAAEELGVGRPLHKVGLTKDEIRRLSREAGLVSWGRPSSTCLATRFPYGMAISVEALRMVEKGEAFLRDLGARQVRLRHHGDIARIEVSPADMPLLLRDGNRERVVGYLGGLGYGHVVLDMAGYRPGGGNVWGLSLEP